MTTISIFPARNVGDFALGRSLTDTLSLIKSKSVDYKRIKIVYDEKNITSNDIIVNIEDPHIQLRFDPVSQRLREIELPDLSSLQSFSIRDVPVRPPIAHDTIQRTVGITFPGSYDPTRGLYIVQYLGVCVIFRVPSSLQTKFQNSDAPHTLEETPKLIASRILVHYGNDAIHPAASIPTSPGVFEPVRLLVNQGLQLVNRRSLIKLGCSPQDVISELGAPSNTYRSDATGEGDSQLQGGCYVFQYRSLGIDLSFEAAKHRLSGIVAHCNRPDQPDFAEYCKCNFSISVCEGKQHQKAGAIIEPDSKWSEIVSTLGDPGRPLVRTSGKDEHPFGPSLYYNYSRLGLVFEANARGHVASVTLIRPLLLAGGV